MPSDPLNTVRSLIAAAVDERTNEHEALSKARAACLLIHEHKLLDHAGREQPLSPANIAAAIDAATDFVSMFWGGAGEDRRHAAPRRGRGRY